jgi:flavin-dependent dehydrogenase
MPLTFDALVVGAGPAGCAAAYDLARAGRRVLLLEKRVFPRHKACACGLTRKTLKALRYSVEPVLERSCRDVVLQEAGPAFLRGRRVADKACEVRVRLRQPFCAMAVRERFDAYCLEQTLERGAEMRRIESIVAVREHERELELEVTLPGGAREVLRAPVLIGADGSNGQMRRLAHGIALARREGRTLEAISADLPPEPGWYARGFALEATVPYTVLPASLPAGDAPMDLVFDFSPIAGGYGWLFPKGDHINIGVGGFVPQGASGPAAGESEMAYESVTRGLLSSYVQQKLGVDLGAVPQAHVSGQHLGLGGHLYVPEGRILLAGDAAGLVDGLTGEGIHSALVSGQAAAGAVLSTTAGTHAAQSYARHLEPLRETLAFSHRAARSFYREPERGFKVMRAPLLRQLVLKTYADGLPTTALLTRLARRAV